MDKLYVYKSIELLREFKSANLVQQRVICYICNLVHEQGLSNEALQLYTFSINDFIKRSNLAKNGQLYKAVREAIYLLQEKSSWIKIIRDDEIYETTVSWILKANIHNGSIDFYVDPDTIAMLEELNKAYSSSEIEMILKMRRGSSIKLYDLLKPYSSKKNKVAYKPSELLSIMGCETDSTYVKNCSAFLRRVIEPAVEDLNTYTDMRVVLDKIKPGKEIEEIFFQIEKKKVEKKSITLTPSDLMNE